INFSEEENIDFQPQFILTDFEQAAINPAREEFPGVRNKSCHFHLAQNVYRRIRRQLKNGHIVRSVPLFLPDFWSVADNINNAFPRTQNSVEAWHRRWETLIGGAHVGVFKIIQE